MKYLIVLLLSSLVLTKKKVTLAQTAEEDAIDMFARMKYTKDLSPEFSSEEIDGKYTATVTYSKPPHEVKSIDVVLWSINSQGRLVDPPSFEMLTNKDKVFFRTGFRAKDLTDEYGCQSVQEADYISKVCKLELQFISTTQNMAFYRLKYSMTVRIPKSSGQTFIVLSKLN